MEYQEGLSQEARLKEHFAKIRQRLVKAYIERKEGQVNIIALREINSWAQNLDFGLEEINKKRAEIDTFGYDAETRAALLEVYDFEERSAQVDIDAVKDALRTQEIGIKPKGGN